MKGLAPIAALVIGILVISLLSEGVILNNLISRFESVRRAVFEVEIVQAINVLENLRTEIKRGLDYSFYQALYDVAAKGGYSSLDGIKSFEGKACWRIYLDTSNVPQKFVEDIEAQTQLSLSAFGTKLENAVLSSVQINADIPEYSVKLQDLGTSTKITATSTGKLTTAKILYTISNNPNFEKNSNLDISKIYDASKKEFVGKNPVREAIINVDKNQMPLVCKKFSTEFCEPHPNCKQPQGLTCEGLLNTNCPNADEVFKGKANSAVTHIGNTLSDNYASEKISYKVSVKKSETRHDTVVKERELTGDTQCGCKQGHYETIGEPETQIFVCDVYCKRSSLSCEYNYNGAVAAQVDAADVSNSYLVKDKTTEPRNIKLQFITTSTSLPDYQPINVCS